jgi:hypothetical protein
MVCGKLINMCYLEERAKYMISKTEFYHKVKLCVFSDTCLLVLSSLSNSVSYDYYSYFNSKIVGG